MDIGLIQTVCFKNPVRSGVKIRAIIFFINLHILTIIQITKCTLSIRYYYGNK